MTVPPIVITLHIEPSAALLALLAPLFATPHEMPAPSLDALPPPVPVLPLLEASAPVPEPAPPPVSPPARVAPAESGGRRSVWTPERDAILRRDWPQHIDPRTIHAEICSLPGPLVKLTYVAQRAYALRLNRPPGFQSSRAAPATATDVVTAERPTIQRWAAERGLAPAGEPLDLNRVNAKRRDLGLPPFALPARRFGASEA